VGEAGKTTGSSKKIVSGNSQHPGRRHKPEAEIEMESQSFGYMTKSTFGPGHGEGTEKL